MIPKPWIPVDDNTLRDMWLKGSTCAEIGAVIDRTPKSVSSRRAILELPKRDTAMKWYATRREVRRTGILPPPNHSFGRVKLPDGCKPVDLVARTGCCWPVNDGGPYLFCDMPKDGNDYCTFHNEYRVA